MVTGKLLWVAFLGVLFGPPSQATAFPRRTAPTCRVHAPVHVAASILFACPKGTLELTEVLLFTSGPYEKITAVAFAAKIYYSSTTETAMCFSNFGACTNSFPTVGRCVSYSSNRVVK